MRGCLMNFSRIFEILSGAEQSALCSFFSLLPKAYDEPPLVVAVFHLPGFSAALPCCVGRLLLSFPRRVSGPGCFSNQLLLRHFPKHSGAWIGLARMNCTAPGSFADTRGAGFRLACPISLLPSGSRRQLPLSHSGVGPARTAPRGGSRGPPNS